jgi:hypothetical protein
MWSPKFDEPTEITRTVTREYATNDLKASVEGTESKNFVVLNVGWLTSIILENNLYQV